MRHHTVLGRRAALVVAATLALGQAWPAAAYQTYGVSAGNQVLLVRWSHLPVRYFVTDRSAPGVSAGQFRDAAARALTTWQDVPTAAVSAEFAGFTSAEPDAEDGQNTLGFLSRPDLDRVLGSTSYLIDETTGEILEADIFFNSAFPWSVAPAGETGKYDLESIVLHETGHLFGLGHSALGETELQAGGGRRVIAAEAVMFPIAFSAGNIHDREPRADDVAGLTVLYPRANASGPGGSMSGRVTKDGQGVFGAHVVAFNPATGALVANFTTDAQGAFTISNLAAGPHIVRVEPVDDADLDSFFDGSVIPTVDLDFLIAYFPGFVVVPRGGGSQPVEVKVTAK
jgi:Carboxypeptidase regulatory-like domain/Matrixin